MTVEGEILSIRKVEKEERGGIEIRIFIPEPRYPSGVVDQCFYDTEEEFKEADKKHEEDKKKYDRDIVDMYSLCLEDVSIRPHRPLPSEDHK